MKISKHEFLSKQNNIKLSECPKGRAKIDCRKAIDQKNAGNGI